MSGTSLFALGTKALTANHVGLTTTGHNIANANVEGYSRQRAELATAQPQFSGSGWFGKGVDVATVSRAHDAVLAREAVNARSLAAMDASRLDLLRQLEAALPGGENGIGHAAGQFLNAMVDLAARPGDAATREVVLGRAAEAAQRFSSAGEHLDRLQFAVRDELAARVGEVNQLAGDIARLNQRIAAVQALGQPPNDLLDARDRALGELATKLQITTVAADDGSVGVFVAGGQRLVLGTQAHALTVEADPDDPSRAALGLREGTLSRRLPTAELGGGAIAGLLRFQDVDLVDARNRLGQMAAALAGRVNEQQSLGLDLRDPPGSGAPIFAVGAPQALPFTRNATDVSGNFIGVVTVSVMDATQLQASEYDLRAAGAPGVWQLTRLADGLVRNIASGDVVDGVRIDVGPPAPATGDRFRLQPVTRAANGMQRMLDDPRGVAAASPVLASVLGSPTGTASVGALRVTSSSLNPDHTATIRFTSNSGNYDWELRDRLSNALVSNGSAVWTAGSPIALNGFELDLKGVPRSGDGFSVARTAYPALNNGNALAYSALRETAIVGRAPLSGGGVGGGQTITDAFAVALSRVGVSAQGAAAAAEISDAAAAQAEAAVAGASGVNLDEEAARLLQYQQSYQAAAKILQVAQSVFDSLLEVT